MIVQELSDEQLHIHYVTTLKQYNVIYKQKKDLEEEMLRRFNEGLESKKRKD